MADEDAPKTVTVELLQPLRGPLGGRWAAGERAGFSEAEARDLIKRGIARAPADKMLRDAPLKK